MPCVAAARGTRAPTTTSPLPFNDNINNNPCGKGVVTNVNGVAVTDNLCLPHYLLKNGAHKFVAPITFGP
jgi:hypothetical protein